MTVPGVVTGGAVTVFATVIVFGCAAAGASSPLTTIARSAPKSTPHATPRMTVGQVGAESLMSLSRRRRPAGGRRPSG